MASLDDLFDRAAAGDRDARVITVRGAREHNLKNVDLVIPRDRLVVFTGLSGSGKSSLAFDTIYAEGQRRYVESLSAYARQFLEMMGKPDVDQIDGLSPAISIEQKTTSKNPRSTVGTVTEIYDYMRLLWARVGIPYSPATGLPIESQTVSQMVDRVLALPEKTRLYLLAPVVRGRKGEYRKEIAEFQKKGFQRLKVDGVFYPIDEAPALDKKLNHDIDVVVDRIVVRPDIAARLAESFETALELADGIAVVEFAEAPAEGAPPSPRPHPEEPPPGGVSKERGEGLVGGMADEASGAQRSGGEGESPAGAKGRGKRAALPKQAALPEAPPHPGPLPARGEREPTPRRIVFSSRFACPVSGFTISEIEPRLFSFNSPHGACPHCGGIGHEMRVDPALIIPDETLTLKRGAVAPWARSTSPYYGQTLEAIARHYAEKTTTPWRELPETVRSAILYGSKEPIRFAYNDGLRAYEVRKRFEGVITNLERRYKETESDWSREDISRFMSETPCSVCGGRRLKPEALAVRIAGSDIAAASALSVRAAHAWFGELTALLTDKQQEIAARILKEIRDRLTFLVDVGLEYLTLARASGTLSGGESQRIRLASQIGSGLTGVLYVLDEPSIGLHQRDNERLLGTLRRLRDLGNTVIVVEHDEDAILQADYVFDIGPGAGIHGGEIVARGTPPQIMANPASLTGRYLTGELSVGVPAQRRKAAKGKILKLVGARGNNLKGVTAEIPLGTFTCVTGVSGGGKSTLVIDTLYKAVARRLNNAMEHPAPFEALHGLEHLDKVIDIDQSPIGRTPRSNPTTYIGAFTPIREWYAGLPEAKARGYGPGRFSFNVKGGRCEACSGDGVLKIEMHFLPDVYVTCDVCKGKRYDRETLEVRYRDRSIADLLDMTVEEARELFKAVPPIREKMATLARVGLDYIHVGQQANTLSGGEAQRVKLSKELSKRATGRTLYILDEPTTGLHFHDTAKLLEVLHELVDQGNSVVVIEHNLEVIKTADWVIDLGPEGGDGGGEIVAQGTPEEIARAEGSYTGRFLREVLARRPLRARREAAE